MRDSRPEVDEAISGLPWIRAVFRLTPPLQDLIHGFKYRHERRNIAFLAAWLRWREEWIDDLARTYDALVPVPLHPARRRERGYNQAETLALEIARAESRRIGSQRLRTINRRIQSQWLRRVRHTVTQTRLKRGARAENLEGAFQVDDRKGEGIVGKRILLIDDVCTTGSTLAHCREALLRAGAARVDALTLAWVEHKMTPRDGIDRLETAAGIFA